MHSFFLSALQSKWQRKTKKHAKIDIFDNSYSIAKNSKKVLFINCSLHGLSSYSLSHSDSGRHKEYAKYCTKQIFRISGTVLMFNVMAGNIPQIKDVRLPCAI